MPDLDLDAIEQRVNAATEGPWEAPETILGIPCGTVFGPGRAHVLYHAGPHAGASFVAHARTDVPALLAEVRRLRAEQDAIRAALARHPRCDLYEPGDPIQCGWKRAVADIQAALDGQEQP